MASKVQHQLEPWSHLEGKIVMVTGASSGLGHEFCLDLAQAGCRIVATARRVDRLNALCDQINKMEVPTGTGGSRRAIAVELDVTANGPTIEACVEKAWDAFGRIDVLINNAGMRGESILSLKFSEAEFNRVQNTNFRGAWLVSKYVGARMRGGGGGGGGGSIINISLAGYNITQYHGAVAYGSSKAALDSMTKIMALELGRYNIRVNSIVPGILKSEITEELFKNYWVYKTFIDKVFPLQTTGTTNPAITTLIRYFHDSSSFITGNIFIADAGVSLPGIPIYSSL